MTSAFSSQGREGEKVLSTEGVEVALDRKRDTLSEMGQEEARRMEL